MRNRTVIPIALCALCTSAPVYAENGTFEHLHCYSGQIQTMKHSDANSVNSVTLFGTTRAVTPGQLLDNMSTQCIGLFGQAEGATFVQGFCEYLDKDSDRFFFRYERSGAEGVVRSVSGTGKYQTMTIQGTYTNTGYPQRPGMLQMCSQVKGKWERP